MDRDPYYRVQMEDKSWPLSGINGTEIFAAPKVHVNPNFKSTKSSVIHVNPRMHQKPVIHVNPKIMKDILPVEKSNIPQIPIVKSINHKTQSVPDKSSMQKFIHVNPKLMKELSCIARADIEATNKNAMSNAVRAPTKTNQISSCDDKLCKSPTKQCLLTISRRKLVRMSAKSKRADSVKSPNTLKVIRVSKSSISRLSPKKTAVPNILSKFAPNKHKQRSSAYKIDRTIVEHSKRKKVRAPDIAVRSVNKGLVAIGGVMYQSSRTQLVRSGTDPSVNKKRKSVGTTKSGTFVLAKNGKKLHRLPLGEKDGSRVSRYAITRTSPKGNSAKRIPPSIVQSSHKNVMSFKAKQRSLQILRDKRRKNFIPCLIFRRFGYCANHAKGICSKLHDKKQVALCRNFLQGKCLLDECPMSHDIGPEKMPTCKYFLEGCCIRDACPYLHVKLSPNTPLCAQFLRGYCVLGSKCKQRHAYICPEFEKAGKCPKGKHCPYPHQLKSAAAAVSVSKVRVGKNTAKPASEQRESRVASRDNESGVETRIRYYDTACPSDEQITSMRQNLMKQMSLMKATLGVAESVDDNDDNSACLDENIERESISSNGERPKRPPIGPLPAYIPIN